MACALLLCMMDHSYQPHFKVGAAARNQCQRRCW